MADILKIQIQLTNADNGANVPAGISGQTANSNAQAFMVLNRATAAAKRVAAQVVNRRLEAKPSSTSNNALQDCALTALNAAINIGDIASCFPGNPVLGVMKIASMGASAISGIAQIAQRNNEIKWQNRRANELARRAGYLSNQNR